MNQNAGVNNVCVAIYCCFVLHNIKTCFCFWHFWYCQHFIQHYRLRLLVCFSGHSVDFMACTNQPFAFFHLAPENINESHESSFVQTQKLKPNICTAPTYTTYTILTENTASTYLASCEESCASLVTAGKILSLRSLPPDRRRTAPTFSTRLARCWAVHFLTTAFRWLSEKGEPVQKSKI